jgi:hypothetical protein
MWSGFSPPPNMLLNKRGALLAVTLVHNRTAPHAEQQES